MSIRYLTSLLLLVTVTAFSGQLFAGPSSPGQPDTGYGSQQNYVSSGHKQHFRGNPFNPWAGKWCWYHMPKTLKYGSSAPVVIMLHGYALIAPEIYDRHIEHLTRQGVIVIYPQINKGGVTGLLSDSNQNTMFERSVYAVNKCLSKIGSKARTDEIFLYGHSLGGLIASVWHSNPDAPRVQGALLANPAANSMSAVPDFVKGIITITPIDYQALAPAMDVPVMILTGNEDDLAPPAQSLLFAAALTNAPSVKVYQANSDYHNSGAPLWADHMAPIHNDGFMLDFMMDLLGGRARTNAMDYRYYWAALDALMDGQSSLEFDMGAWSDGVPVTPVSTLE